MRWSKLTFSVAADVPVGRGEQFVFHVRHGGRTLRDHLVCFNERRERNLGIQSSGRADIMGGGNDETGVVCFVAGLGESLSTATWGR